MDRMRHPLSKALLACMTWAAVTLVAQAGVSAEGDNYPDPRVTRVNGGIIGFDRGFYENSGVRSRAADHFAHEHREAIPARQFFSDHPNARGLAAHGPMFGDLQGSIGKAINTSLTKGGRVTNVYPVPIYPRHLLEYIRMSPPTPDRRGPFWFAQCATDTNSLMYERMELHDPYVTFRGLFNYGGDIESVHRAAAVLVQPVEGLGFHLERDVYKPGEITNLLSGKPLRTFTIGGEPANVGIVRHYFAGEVPEGFLAEDHLRVIGEKPVVRLAPSESWPGSFVKEPTQVSELPAASAETGFFGQLEGQLGRVPVGARVRLARAAGVVGIVGTAASVAVDAREKYRIAASPSWEVFKYRFVRHIYTAFKASVSMNPLTSMQASHMPDIPDVP